MSQLIYCLACLYKTLALLSLIIYLPPNQYRTKISRGFLWLYMNEIVLFFVSFFIHYAFGQAQYALVDVFKLITNVYFVLIYGLVMTWLLVWKKELLARNVEVMSIVLIIFTWLAVMIVGVMSVVIVG